MLDDQTVGEAETGLDAILHPAPGLGEQVVGHPLRTPLVLVGADVRVVQAEVPRPAGQQAPHVAHLAPTQFAEGRVVEGRLGA